MDHPKIVLDFFPITSHNFPLPCAFHAALLSAALAMICGRGSLLIIAIIVATIYSFRMLLLLPQRGKRSAANQAANNLEQNELSGKRLWLSRLLAAGEKLQLDNYNEPIMTMTMTTVPQPWQPCLLISIIVYLSADIRYDLQSAI